MADKINPTGGKVSSSELLPRYYRTDSNKKFLQATVDQLIQPGTVKKVNGYVGRQNSKSTTGEDIFVQAADSVRQNYQLEPGLIIKDELENTTFFKDYQDYINQINVFGGNVKNHSRVNQQEFYSWDPHINWDKFVNFQQYFWLPYGPDPIKIVGAQESIVSTYKVEIKAEADNNTYVFYPNGLIQNPSIQLYRGQTYRFEINSPGNPFSIKTKRIDGETYRYDIPEITGNAVEVGVIEFFVPMNSPDIIYYVSEADVNLGGVFQILSIDENTTFNLETDLLGKKTYTLPDGTSLSNGMKLSFVGNIIPEHYKVGNYYVEGVGESIELIAESSLEIIGNYTTRESVLFDADPFDNLPFGDATTYAGKKDYIVINRSSKDSNPWSRYNRWFHKDTIEASARYNGKIADIDQTYRAVRPIIEFEPNLKLFNFGIKSVSDVDLIDTYTTDVFSKIEGQLGYNIDGIDVAQGQRILFAADTDIRVKNKIFKVDFLILDGVRQIHLTEESTPTVFDSVLIKEGVFNQGSWYWFDGSQWLVAQQKNNVNQPPLFDIFDQNGVTFGNKDVYDGSTFNGTKIFSYKLGSSVNDSVLGFPLTYKNIDNIGDIVFNFNIISDTFQYKDISFIVNKSTSVGYLLKTLPNNEIKYVNGWQTSSSTNVQAAIRIYKNSNITNNFEIDIFDDPTNLNDLEVIVLVNGIRLEKPHWSIQDTFPYKKIILENSINKSDILTIKAYAKQHINSNGFYEIPIGLQNNPLNDDVTDFTLGEISSHVNSIIDNIQNQFTGIFPGSSNIRDLGNITQFGTKFVQHSGPIGLALYHLTSQNNNIIRAIENAQYDYNKFKRNFIKVAENLGIEADPAIQVNAILQEINKDKPTSFPYYFSDMVPYAGNIRTDLKVFDYRIKTYPLSSVFNLDELSNKAVLVYLNNTDQLLHGKDYTFDDQGFVVISAPIVNNDIITIYEFENTNGCFVPPTPTKLGLWPKYEPKIYLDTTLITPQQVIQGHDGSIVLAYGDYRDAIILELEKRIYNNIKIKYDPEIFDAGDFLPVYNRDGAYSLKEFDEVLSTNFYSWANLIDRDFTKPLSYNNQDPRTYNYREMATPDGRTPLPGYWKGIYRWMLETDRPNLCPWEMLGFSEEPAWWQQVYGPAPYTSDNLILWDDLADGIVREPGTPPRQIKKYVRTYLKGNIPVNQQGQLLSPVESGLASGIVTNSTAGDFVFGDVSPVENAWRRSSHYPFGILITLILTQPAKSFGLLLDRSRVVRNLAGQIVYSETKKRIRPKDILLPSIFSSSTNVKTSGIINYLVDYIQSDKLKSYDQYFYDLQNIQVRLAHRIGGFTSKEKFKLLLDSKTPLTSGSVFVPAEDYEIILNTSSPVKKIIYSGVIITKLEDGFSLKGYSKTQPFFKYYNWIKTGIEINIGGVSENYVTWTPEQQYSAGKIVAYSNRFYRVKTRHTTETIFNPIYYTLLPSLPIVGGRNAYIRQAWDRTEEIVLPYGTKLRTIQDVVDFLLGYGEYLKDQGFIFDNFNNELKAIANWETSAKEFMFWTTQNWSTGEDKWSEWQENQPVMLGQIVRYNGDYYRAINNIDPFNIFDYNEYVKLDGLSSIGSSVISLSPAAIALSFSSPQTVVDDIRNQFNKYEIFKVDGSPIQPQFLNNYREENTVSYTPVEDGIYGATFYLVQKEQIIVLKNNTLFNDTIYNPTSGYRQERIKVSGYLSSNWNGDFNVPGFIFDQAVIQDWQPWQNYALGDIVKYKQFYYTAKSSMPGNEEFISTKWMKLDSKPTAQLLPNWSYKANQFQDFYNLDSDNFDADQQAMAQHLIGYQKRQYLSNIIKDDVSEFKFYQGMIVEKGTQNVLNKLFDVLSAEGQESITFYEEWALRTGQYGASSSFENIEFIIDEQLVKNNPQGFELVNQVNTTYSDFIIRQTPNDVYLKPIGYNNSPWPLVENKKNYLRTPGYVRSSDVKTVLKTLEDITTEDVKSFEDGNYVWVGFENREWNVYRYSRYENSIVDITYSIGKVTVTLEKLVNFDIGDYLGIDQTSDYNGFYKILEIIGKTVVLSATKDEQPRPFKDQAKATLSYFRSNRVSSIDNIDNSIKIPILENELMWTDDIGNDKWGVWKHNNVYSQNEIVNSSPQQGLLYGRQVLLNSSGNISIVTTNQGESIVLDKTGINSPWLQRQTITAPFITKESLFGLSNSPDSYTGDILALSSDSRWLALGTPFATEVCSNYKGVWDSTTSYLQNSIVVRNSKHFVASSTNTNKDPLVNVRTYNNVSGTTLIGAGVGATFNIVVTNSNYSVTVVNPGTAFAVGNTIRIFGNVLGGDAPMNNLIIKVVSVVAGAASGPIATVSVTGTAKDFWEEISYIPVDSTGINSTLSKQGVISLYEKDSNNIFSLVATILSPLPTQNELFGSSLVFGNNTLFVGTNGYNNNQGIVYRLSYKTITEVSTTYNPIGSSGTTIVLTSTVGIRLGMYLKGTGFLSNQYVSSIDQNTKSIIISALPDSEPSGTIEFTTTSWRYDTENYILAPTSSNSNFGSVLSISQDSSTLVVSAPKTLPAGKVFVYKTQDNSEYSLIKTITGQDENFGSSISVSGYGEYVAISSIYQDNDEIDQGAVTIYKYANNDYTLYQTLVSKTPEVAELFGSKISFMNDYESLIVFSQGADSFIRTKFDNGETTFDNNLTKIFDTIENNGRVDVFDRYATKWVYSESFENLQTDVAGYSSGFAVGSNQVIVGIPNAVDQGLQSGKVYEYRKPSGHLSWQLLYNENDKVNLSQIKRAFLYNRKTNKMISYLDVIDPSQGKIPGIADAEIRFKTFYDPATYSSGTAEVNVDEGMAWTKMHVGALWWDLRTAKFIDSNDTDLIYRNSTWNTIFPFASIDIYEWVESRLTPDQWNELADTEEGITVGISGTSLYDNNVYSVIKKYDTISKTFRNTYYFWVKGKKTIPSIPNRKLSAGDVASLIENPRGADYKYIALTGANSFSLVNVQPLLQDKDVVLSIEYWTSENTGKNVHSQWKIINNETSTVIPSAVEQKWFDSLSGKDTQGRLVPDPLLPEKLKYGIENRPRQGMFINRFEALKQFIEQVNNELFKNLIVENRDISKLNSYEKEPSTLTGLYDTTLDSDAELRFANIGTFEKPKFSAIIENGKIIGIDIIARGRGYTVAPYFIINGTGIGAKVKSKINNKGQISGYEIISSGEGYTSATTVTLRNYSVLVHSDSEASGAWSIYSYEPTTLTWSRVQSQSYDVRRYWNYVDWYLLGYNEFTSIDHTVNTFTDLLSLECSIGQTVKIKTTSIGTWILLEKYANSESVDWTQNYKIIGKEKGTIQFYSTLYKFENTLYGFDGSLYDSAIFDNSASTELTIILNSLKNEILIDNLKDVYLNLFFNSVRYIFSEQTYVDWIFKTSFIKARHNVGELKEKVTYNSDNLENFEDFINEVKPYRTKVREYVSSYNKLDTSKIVTTDFDLPSTYENGSIVSIATSVTNGVVQSDNNTVLSYPWRHWYDNLGFSVTSLVIVDGGSGYRSEPTVSIISNTGSGATARVFFTNGKINRVVLLTKGSGYLSAPTVVISGGLADGGTPAKVVAILGNGLIRSNLIKLKFDRLSQNYVMSKLQETEVISGNSLVNGSRIQFVLKWAPDITNTFIQNVQSGKATVLINNIEILKDNYTLSVLKSTSKGFTSYSGSLTFKNAPAQGSVVTVNYTKDLQLLNAADRIQFYYDPAAGELGKDLAQLMTGVDYGGVSVHGLNFDIGSGWDSVPYYTDKWASFDETYDDYVVSVAAGTHSFTLPYVPEQGSELNVYYAGKNTDSYTGDGFSTIYNFNINDIYPPTVKVAVTTVISDSPTNVAGSDIITVDDTVGIKQGDVLTISPDVDKTLGFETTVVEVVDSITVKLNQILFKPITAGTSAIFTRTLVDPTDCTINPNGTVFLVEPIPIGANISITAYTSPVRLDDPNYTITGVAENQLNSLQLEYNVLTSEFYVLENSKATIESNLENANDALADKQAELNALYVVLDGLTPADPLYAPTVSDITNLIGTTIPAIQLTIQTEQTNLNDINADIAQNQIDKNEKLDEIADQVDYINTLTPLANNTAIMQTIISDGVPDNQLDPTYKTFTIPGTFPVFEGDQFIWRKAGSDGSVLPQEQDYDTALSGGNLAYSSATGIAADDIIVDGDGFVTPTSSPATEEVVPGQIVDTVAIKVYDRPESGSANIKVDSYIADGITTDFEITQQPNTRTAVIVKFTTGVRDQISGILSSSSTVKNLNIDYTVDYQNRLIKFLTPPPAGEMVSIFSFGFNGSNILDLDYFIGDGVTKEFITKAPWVNEDVTYLVYINGTEPIPGTPSLFRTDSSYESSNRMGLIFASAPEVGDLINFVIVKGPQQTYSVTKTERFPGNGTTTYNLQNVVGDSLPAEANMLVRVNNKFLQGPNNSYFAITGNRVNYSIDSTKYLPYTLSINDIFVYAGGNLLVSGIDYVVDLSGINIKITQNVRKTYLNQELIISVKQTQDYEYVPPSGIQPPQIIFNQTYDSTDLIEVLSSYRHNILDIQRTEVNVTSNLELISDTPEFYNYKAVSGGVIQLDRHVIDENYVWVIKNGILLTPSADFRLNEDKKSIKLAFYPDPADIFTIITYGSKVLTSGISYMQFKDMLNRVHYKRLNANKRSTLVKNLKYTDSTIEVEDASNFDRPSIPNNKPGIIEIRGERIEFFTLTEKTEGLTTTYVLGQLRRGTLGTGVAYVHRAGSYVQDLGPSETIPYTESTIIEQVKSDGTNIVPLSFAPMDPQYGLILPELREYDEDFVSTIPELYFIQPNDIEVFVGGYSSVPWVSGAEYVVDDIVEVGSYTYRCVEAHTSTLDFFTDKQYWVFFVGNIRLKKKPYHVHNINEAPYSPEGDIQLDAEFAVDGVSNNIWLTHKLEFGTRVTVVKRTGTAWDSTTNILEDDSKIARFLKAVPGIWYANIGKYENKAGIPSSFDSDNGTFDSESITFDQE